MLNIAPLDARALRYRLPSLSRLVRLADGSEWLEWEKAREWHVLSPPPGTCLWSFVRLDGPSSQQVEAFAAAWGPLNDTGFEELGDEADRMQWHFSESFPNGVLREPVSGWRGRARQLGALLRGAASLQKGEPMMLADRLDALYGGHVDSDGTKRLGARLVDRNGRAQMLLPSHASLGEQRQALASLAAEWLPASDLVLRPTWDPGADAAAMSIEFLAHRQPLVAVLGIELAAALTSPSGLWSCDGCPYPYTPTRRPRHDRRRFCPACSKSRAPAKLWWREHRAQELKG